MEMLNKQNKTLEGYVETIFEVEIVQVCVLWLKLISFFVVQLYDTDGDGTISRQEIVDFCKRFLIIIVFLAVFFGNSSPR